MFHSFDYKKSIDLLPIPKKTDAHLYFIDISGSNYRKWLINAVCFLELGHIATLLTSIYFSLANTPNLNELNACEKRISKKASITNTYQKLKQLGNKFLMDVYLKKTTKK